MSDTVLQEVVQHVCVRVVRSDSEVHVIVPYLPLPIVLNEGETIEISVHPVPAHPNAHLMQMTIARVT